MNFGLNIDLNWVFKLINIARGTEEGGWLETTYLSDGVRIGRYVIVIVPFTHVVLEDNFCFNTIFLVM